jgi:hypothetical protein
MVYLLDTVRRHLPALPHFASAAQDHGLDWELAQLLPSVMKDYRPSTQFPYRLQGEQPPMWVA